MKLNISYPVTGCQKSFECYDEHKLRIFYDKRMGAEIGADALGSEWAGYVVRITGGNDREGFPMKQGVLTTGRVRILLSEGQGCYKGRKDGERKRKSVRGCIVDANLSVLCLKIVKKGFAEIPGLTDTTIPLRLGPKRANGIRKLFNLTKEDDVRHFVIKRPVNSASSANDAKKKSTKHRAPKIQRLITPQRLQHKRHRFNLKKQRAQKKKEIVEAYMKLVSMRDKELKKKQRLAKRKRSASASQSSIA